jgi:hypothetical protein
VSASCGFMSLICTKVSLTRGQRMTYTLISTYLVIFCLKENRRGSIFCHALLKDVYETWYKTSRNKKQRK